MLYVGVLACTFFLSFWHKCHVFILVKLHTFCWFPKYIGPHFLHWPLFRSPGIWPLDGGLRLQNESERLRVEIKGTFFFFSKAYSLNIYASFLSIYIKIRMGFIRPMIHYNVPNCACHWYSIIKDAFFIDNL